MRLNVLRPANGMTSFGPQHGRGGRPQFRGLPPKSFVPTTRSFAHPPAGAHADSFHALLNCSLSRRSPRSDECRDLAERERVQGRSGDRIRAKTVRGSLLRSPSCACRETWFRVTMTSPRPRSDVLKPHFGSSCAPGIAGLARSRGRGNGGPRHFCNRLHNVGGICILEGHHVEARGGLVDPAASPVT